MILSLLPIFSMERWVGKIAVVTGASAGVGAAIAVELVKQGLTVVGVARREENIQELLKKVEGSTGKLVPLRGDVSTEEGVIKIFEFVRQQFKTIHVLVNNAGFMVMGKFVDGNPADWKNVLDVNVLGVVTCAKYAVKLMTDSGVDDGHIINVNSVVGHIVPPSMDPELNIYPPSKFAVTAISETLRNEMRFLKSKVKVTNLCPGYIKTEFIEVACKNQTAERQKNLADFLDTIPGLEAEDLAETVVFLLSTPPHVQVNELILTPI